MILNAPTQTSSQTDVPQEMLENNVDAANTEAPGSTNEKAPKELLIQKKRLHQRRKAYLPNQKLTNQLDKDDQAPEGN